MCCGGEIGLKIRQGAKTAAQSPGPLWVLFRSLTFCDPFCLKGFDYSWVFRGPTLGIHRRKSGDHFRHSHSIDKMGPRFGFKWLEMCQNSNAEIHAQTWAPQTIRDPFCLNGFDCSRALLGALLGTFRVFLGSLGTPGMLLPILVLLVPPSDSRPVWVKLALLGCSCRSWYYLFVLGGAGVLLGCMLMLLDALPSIY